ncbi:MAG TPA: SAM-dependent methyltransferase [Gemmatimonadetes bacterium]|nr:SAM-dependent methyltransferase [Gemmatimonadota bacterium]|tara:strand:+ start:11208 stop:12482 length:1275 start_codon:yes stop_codon:yes gene_type:complete
MTGSNFHFRDTCRLCENNKLEKVIELTPTPPGNYVLRADEIEEPRPSYPLEVYFCNDCAHVQLGHVVDPRILFQRRYTYVSSTSPVFVAHLREYASAMIERFSLGKGSLIADIGSNDGTCLRFFQEHGFEVLGIDPATDIARKASDQGIETIPDFFGFKKAKHLRKERGPATLITSHNVLAHVDDLSDIIRGVEHWLDDDGLFVMEVGYFVDVYQKVWFDTIYHEHLDYHTLAPLLKFLARHDLEVIEVERIAPQGGSIRVISQKRGGPYSTDASVDHLLELEHSLKMDRPETFRAYNRRINEVRDSLGKLLMDLKQQGHSIAGYGAPTKATTMLMHFGLSQEMLDFTLEDNPLKHGCFLPGAMIPILPADELYVRKPDYVVILAWNFAHSIIKKHRRYHEEGGRFILPMPVPEIVKNLDTYLN